MSRQGPTVAVIFGGRSVEHDVSIITGQQILAALPSDCRALPVYITREGSWYTGEPLLALENFQGEELTRRDDVLPCMLSPDARHHGLIVNPLAPRWRKSELRRIDIAFPALHGTHGEDGTLQGLLELADIPYVGCGTLASALCNDKALTKTVLRAAGIPVLDELGFSRERWLDAPDAVLDAILTEFDFPLFIKPATLGSSIGIGRAESLDMLRASIDIAANFDRRILVEPAFQDGIEINCSVLGQGQDLQVSPLEQPLGWDDFLSYEDKYLRGSEGMKSAERLIPAPISTELASDIQTASRRAFQAVDGRGIARVDFLVNPEQRRFYLNEINTMPGSLAMYLWAEAQLSREELVAQLLELARSAHIEKRRNITDYRSNLVAIASQRGSKGIKRKG